MSLTAGDPIYLDPEMLFRAGLAVAITMEEAAQIAAAGPRREFVVMWPDAKPAPTLAEIARKNPPPIVEYYKGNKRPTKFVRRLRVRP